MTRVLRSEWTKLRTLRSTGWLLLALIAGPVALSTVVVVTQDATFCPPTGCTQDMVRLSLSGVYIGQAAVVVLAALAVTAEYGTGTIHSTLAATPRRVLALAAKAGVVTGAAVIVGAIGVVGTYVTGHLILPRNGFPALSLGDGATLRATAGTVLYLGLIALLSLGIGYALRDTAVSITTVIGLLYVLPILATLVNDEEWRTWILRLAPMSAGLSIQATRQLDVLPIAPWPGLAVLAAYATAALIAGGVAFTLRDA